MIERILNLIWRRSAPSILSPPINIPQAVVVVTRGRCNANICLCTQGCFPSTGGPIEDIPCSNCEHAFSRHGTAVTGPSQEALQKPIVKSGESNGL